MGTLHVILRVGLAYPLSLSAGPLDTPIRIALPDSGNTVTIDPPSFGPPCGPDAHLGAFEEIVVHVERQCGDKEGRDITYANNERLHINRDAGRVFWQLFEHLRDLESQAHFVATYPVAPAEVIQRNPLVKVCHLEWTFDGETLGRQTFTGLPLVPIGEVAWADAARRLEKGISVPAYRSFALDAIYFEDAGDPLRAIVMACAAWETALRQYLETVASIRDPAYYVASSGQGIPRLYEFVKVARGGPLFYDQPEMELARKTVEDLPQLRNKLLHRGQRDVIKDVALGCAVPVLNAIEWLFQDVHK